MKYVYLMSPIDKLPDEHVNGVGDMRKQAKELLVKAGLTVYDPAAAWTISDGLGEPDGVLFKINELAIDCCNCGLALYPSTSDSVGVPMEIEHLRMRGTPVAVVTDRVWSFALAADGIETFDLTQLEEAVHWVDLEAL